MKNILGVGIAMLLSLSAQAAPKKVLIVLSSEDKITLKNGVIHPTGYFLSELAVPLKGLVQAGYEPVFANPKGNEPVMDKVSDSAFWFGNDVTAYNEAKGIVVQYSTKTSRGSLSSPLRLSELTRNDLENFSGLFVPGGHAPMEDLLIDKSLGKILSFFHKTKKPTALICHGPIALLSALPDAEGFVESLNAKQVVQTSWIYKGYKMTSFSTKEEQQEEPGQDNALGGFVKFYPDEALGHAGGETVVKALKWQSHVVRDRELITAQNPMSDVEFTKTLLQALSEGR